MSFELKVEASAVLDGVLILSPSVFEEPRGNTWTSYLDRDFDPLLPDGLVFKHDKFSESNNNVLRGIHGDHKSWKLVTCVFGEIQLVVADMREGSSSYLKWQKFVIHRKNQQLILIPPGFGNSYYVSAEVAVVHYKLAYHGDYIDADQQFTVAWNDPRLAIDWPVNDPILSARDARNA
jgi:dTDP-4-dehydrorhamnose 3,5-epimerase